MTELETTNEVEIESEEFTEELSDEALDRERGYGVARLSGLSLSRFCALPELGTTD